MAPPKSPPRALLLGGHLFLKTCPPDMWWHISLVYLNPQRPTYLKAHPCGRDSRDQTLLEVRVSDSMPECRTDVELAKELELDNELHMSLWKLVSYDRPHVPFVVGKPLTVVPLEQACRLDHDNNFKFWKGSAVELREEFERRRKAIERARKQRRDAARTRSASAPAAPRRRRHRRAQRPPGAGVLMLPLQDGAVTDSEVGAAPAAPALRLLAEAEEIDDDSDQDQPFRDVVEAGGSDHHSGGAFASDWNQAAAVAHVASRDASGSGTFLNDSMISIGDVCGTPLLLPTCIEGH